MLGIFRLLEYYLVLGIRIVRDIRDIRVTTGLGVVLRLLGYRDH
jgi:hypothetical protein